MFPALRGEKGIPVGGEDGQLDNTIKRKNIRETDKDTNSDTPSFHVLLIDQTYKLLALTQQAIVNTFNNIDYGICKALKLYAQIISPISLPECCNTSCDKGCVSLVRT